MLQKSDLEDDIAAYIAERLPQAEMKVLLDVGANVGWFATQFLKAYEPWKLRRPAKFEVEKNRLIVKLPPEASGQIDPLRQLLTMNLWFENGSRLQRVSCI